MSSDPGFADHSNFVAKFSKLGGSVKLEGFWDFSMREFSEIDEAVLAELKSLSACRCVDFGLGDF